MEFVSFGHYWLTPSSKKRKVPPGLSSRLIYFICSPKASNIRPQGTASIFNLSFIIFHL
jgi:hypothetical protein